MKILYINNYNCPINKKRNLPDNHLWGVDRLAKEYDVTMAQVPSYNWIRHPRLREIMRNISLAFRYYNHHLVYSACGELTDGFAFMRKIGLWHGRLFKIQHHSYGARICENEYEKIMYISPIIRDYIGQLNFVLLEWGGDYSFVDKCRHSQSVIFESYDFVSAGKSARDYDTMIDACEKAGGKSLIITDFISRPYDTEKITVISGDERHKNSLDDLTVYGYCLNSRFIVIPCNPLYHTTPLILAGLTSFADAAILGKPVLISDSTNMGVDVVGLGIGLTYRAGDSDDMASKMKQLLKTSDSEYEQMCINMKKYASSHNYDIFCNQLTELISESK